MVDWLGGETPPCVPTTDRQQRRVRRAREHHHSVFCDGITNRGVKTEDVFPANIISVYLAGGGPRNAPLGRRLGSS